MYVITFYFGCYPNRLYNQNELDYRKLRVSLWNIGLWIQFFVTNKCKYYIELITRSLCIMIHDIHIIDQAYHLIGYIIYYMARCNFKHILHLIHFKVVITEIKTHKLFAIFWLYYNIHIHIDLFAV